MADPVLRGPCTVTRWLDTHRIIVTRIATRAVAEHLDKAEPVTTDSSTRLQPGLAADQRTAGSPLLATADQWGASPFRLHPMSPHGVSQQARNLLDGIVTVHRALAARVSTGNTGSPVSEPPAPTSARY